MPEGENDLRLRKENEECVALAMLQNCLEEVAESSIMEDTLAMNCDRSTEDLVETCCK